MASWKEDIGGGIFCVRKGVSRTVAEGTFRDSCNREGEIITSVEDGYKTGVLRRLGWRRIGLPVIVPLYDRV